jgi:hypothetical protein
MQRVLVIFLLLVFYSASYGQKPESFLYQAVVKNDKGDIVAAKQVAARISIISDNPSGPVVYSETQTVKTDKDGLASMIIGTGANRLSSITSIDWNAGTFFVKIETDLTGNQLYKELCTTQMVAVPGENPKKVSRRLGEIVIEDQFLMTRKYVGEYLDFRHTGSETTNGPNIIWIKTSLDKTFGKISAYGKNCEFITGDKLYIRRIFYSPGDVTGYWIYQIENDASVYYKLTEFQYDKKAYVETMFQ